MTGCGRSFAVAALLALAAFGGGARRARADEAILEEAPAAPSAMQVRGPLELAFQPHPKLAPHFPRALGLLGDLPPVLRDAQVDLYFRSYYFEEIPFDQKKSQAWTYGGWLSTETGWLADVLSFKATLFTSQKIYAPSNEGGTELLGPGQSPYWVLGDASARLRYGDHLFVAWRQELDLPFVNRADNRMTPNTFEAYVLRGRIGDLDYLAGQIDRIKARDADTFVPMSQAAGATGTDQGMTVFGFAWMPLDRFVIGAFNEFAYDTFNTLYGELDYAQPLPWEGFEAKVEAQFTDQRSVGAELLSHSPFAVQRWGGRLSISWLDFVLRPGLSVTTRGHDILSPFGTDPNFLKLMQSDFSRSGEAAWLLGLSYGFAHLHLPDLSTIFYFAAGQGAVNDSGESLPNQKEYDWTIDYQITRGVWRGLWFRFRMSFLDEDHEPHTQREIRAIVNYNLPLI